MKAYILLAEGFEIAEALVPYDILCRARVDVRLVSIVAGNTVSSSNGVPVTAHLNVATADLTDGDLLVLPGGMPGALNLRDSAAVSAAIDQYHQAGKWLAAICAAPMVLGLKGLLTGREATCFPGFEKDLLGAKPQQKSVVRDGQFITACGAGAAYAFGHELAAVLVGKDTADAVMRQMMFEVYE